MLVIQVRLGVLEARSCSHQLVVLLKSAGQHCCSSALFTSVWRFLYVHYWLLDDLTISTQQAAAYITQNLNLTICCTCLFHWLFPKQKAGAKVQRPDGFERLNQALMKHSTVLQPDAAHLWDVNYCSRIDSQQQIKLFAYCKLQ